MTTNLQAAKLQVMKAVAFAPKGGTNQHDGYKYSSETDLIGAVRGAMIDAGLTLVPASGRCVTTEGYDTERGHRNRVVVERTFALTHLSGESEPITVYGEGIDVGEKATYKAMTGAKKYAIREAFLLECGDDPDNGGHDEERRAPAAQPPPRRQPEMLPPQPPTSQAQRMPAASPHVPPSAGSPVTEQEAMRAFPKGWPMGRTKGTPFHEVSSKDMEYFISRPLDPQSNFYAKNLEQYNICKRELAFRANGGSRAAAEAAVDAQRMARPAADVAAPRDDYDHASPTADGIPF